MKRAIDDEITSIEKLKNSGMMKNGISKRLPIITKSANFFI